METEETVTLEQAGSRFGVGADALQRLIRIGALPEARKEIRPSGGQWIISAAALPVIAERQGWTIDLRGDEPVIALEDYRLPAAATSGRETGPMPDDPGRSGDELTFAADAILGGVIDAVPGAAASPFLDGMDTTEFAPLNGSTGQRSSLGSMDEVLDANEIAIEVESMQLTEEAGRTEADTGAALVPHGAGSPEETKAEGAPSMSEVLDLHLLDRLLGVQEERIHAVAEASHTRQTLEATSHNLDSTKAELEVQRREHLIASDRFREERMARAVADAKVAELRDRVIREMALAEAEKEARAEAVARSIRAERDAAAAMATMGWRARRRYRRQLDT